MNKQCMEILKCGGKITDEELDLLKMSLPHISDTDVSGIYIDFYEFYLQDIKGYALVNLMPYTCDPNDTEEMLLSFLRLRRGCEPFQLIFKDITRTLTFSSYDELEKFSDVVSQYNTFIDPRNDPEFREIFDRGYMTCEEDYDIFHKYYNYYEIKDRHICAIIMLGENEKCWIFLDYVPYLNQVYFMEYLAPEYKEDFFYQYKDEPIIHPFY